MKLYCGIDLHSNNSVIVILDETDKVIYQKKLNNDLELILQQLSTFIDDIVAIAIESTFNWYWLVLFLMVRRLRLTKNMSDCILNVK